MNAPLSPESLARAPPDRAELGSTASTATRNPAAQKATAPPVGTGGAVRIARGSGP